ncbi:hypothetical protein [Pseudomonas sp. PNPG3]|uniref:hypothetical protein n=1 Tax=Pseudomonas sp. PNPG3 TaxID=2919497 RepID=UPI001FFC430C|nr:hypothetical protein [Pseudomonas sp. PNPG3]MCK2124713.1 hypothetical protein [Pseudomonas sp. PNPG3]
MFTRYTGIQVAPSDGTTGAVILGMGVLLIGINGYVDHKAGLKVDPASAADRQVIEAFFSKFDIDTLDLFIEHGKSMYTYVPAIYYYYGIQEFVESAHFHLNDLELKGEVEGLYAGLNKALSQGEYFHECSNEKLQKFDSKRDIYRYPDAKEAHENFRSGVYDAEAHLKKLNQLVKAKFPGFDTGATSSMAIARRSRYESHTLGD